MTNDEKGITMVVLLITVIILVILMAAGTQYGGASIQKTKLQNFSYQLQQIQGRVDTISEKMRTQSDTTDYTTVDDQILGQNITLNQEAVKLFKEKKDVDYNTITVSSPNYDKYYTADGSSTLYRYLTREDIENILDIKNPQFDVIINFKTREVISMEGQTMDGVTYHSLEDLRRKE